MFDPDRLAALATVLRHGSFDAAARQLSLTPSAISQRIRALENSVGTTLVNRTTPCTATPTGARLARHYDDLTLLDAALAADIGLETSPARLRCAVNADSLATWFLPALAGTDTLYDIVVDDQDHSADWLRRGEVSAAVTADAGPVQGCDSYALGALTYRATASPEFVARHFPNGLTVAALENAPALTFNLKDQLQTRWVQTCTGQRLALKTHLLPSTQAFVEAARLGLGWGMNPAPLVDPLISSGDLIDLAPDTPFRTELFWQIHRLVAAPLSDLTKAIRNQARHALHLSQNTSG